MLLDSETMIHSMKSFYKRKDRSWVFRGMQSADKAFSNYACAPSLDSALNALEVFELTGYLKDHCTQRTLITDILRCYSFTSGPKQQWEGASLFGQRVGKPHTYGICELTKEHQDIALLCWDSLTESPKTFYDTSYDYSLGQLTFGEEWQGLPDAAPAVTHSYSYTPTVYRPKRPLKKPCNSKNVVRDESGGCFEVVHSKAWGTTLIPCLDPDGADITKKDKEDFRQIEAFPKIPTGLWQRWVDLCFEFCPPQSQSKSKAMDNRSLEVSCLLLRNEGDMRTWKILIPKQVVGGGSVKADFTTTVDIETGDQHSIFPPPGWLHAGSSHSHNTMAAFFSGTDDKFELGVPGLHVVLGEISHKEGTYTHKASVVLRETRKIVETEDFIDLEPGEEAPVFHTNVLKVISKHVMGPRIKVKDSKKITKGKKKA